MLLSLVGACIAPFAPDPVPVYPTVVFDPASGDVPLPSDLVWDADLPQLDLPIDESLSAADADARRQLNRLDGWSSVTPITFRTTHPVLPASLSAVEVWELADPPARLAIAPELDDARTTVTVPPPETGWPRRAELLVIVEGGAEGLRTEAGPVGPDVAMGYLASGRALEEHPDAFPGTTRAEREDQARDLDAIRRDWARHFAFAEEQGWPVAALWPFHVTARGEVAIDAATSRVPLPSDLLIDPETERVALPDDPEDDTLRVDAKAVVNRFGGFSITGRQLFEVTAELDPRTATSSSVQLWVLTDPPTPVPVWVEAWREDGPCDPDDRDCTKVVVDPGPLPLQPATTYGLVVLRGLHTRDGASLAPTPTGVFVMGAAPLVDPRGQSALSSVDDVDARRLERTRQDLLPLLEHLGRDEVVSGWTFTTLDRDAALREDVTRADRLGLDPEPVVTMRRPAYALLGDDALTDLFPGTVNPAIPVYVPRTEGIGEVIEGTLLTADHLDPITRRWRDDPIVRPMAFMATVPEEGSLDDPIPMVIFGHGVTTDRRFLVTVAGPLARRGLGAIAIDLPYHGERTVCVERNLVAIPNPLPESLRDITGLEDDLVQWPPCPSGVDATCSPEGACLDADGRPEPFSRIPVIDLRPASGAAFLDTEDLPHIPDRFRQSLVDLGAVRRSLQLANWEAVLGRRIDREDFRYLGQSLGGILGVVYVASDPTVSRAVFNVAGGGLVDVFEQSTFFGPQLDAYLDRIDVRPGTWEHEELIHVAHWLVDSVDPLVVAPRYAERPGVGLIQIDRLDDQLGDFVIPNATSDVLQAVTGLPMSEYPSVLHGDLAIPVVGDAMLSEAADFLAGP
ncbi:MAG: hypothetical protein AAF211_06365 [Myxococcota bacterium]